MVINLKIGLFMEFIVGFNYDLVRFVFYFCLDFFWEVYFDFRVVNFFVVYFDKSF